MNIVQLTSENVLRLNAVSIIPQGNIVTIGGRNGQGKTSVLDSIMMALAGKDSKKHPKPLKEGSEKGFTEIVLSNGWTVKRTYTKAGVGVLKIKSKDGNVFKQGDLNDMFSGLTFDGLAWLNIDSDKQVAILQDLVGLDFKAIDDERKRIFDERTLVNREVVNLRERYSNSTLFDDVPVEPLSISQLIAQMEDIDHRNRDKAKQRASFKQFQSDYEELLIREKKLQDELSDVSSELKSIRLWMDSEGKEISGLVDESIDDIRKKIVDAEVINSKVLANKEHRQLEKRLKEKEIEGEFLTGKLGSLDNDKQMRMAKAKFPIDGLSFDESGVIYNGVPFKQASSAEKLMVSVAIGIALNPELKVLLIRDGSLLDDDNLKIVAQMAEASGHQVWLEKVSTDRGECQIIIEDGMIKGDSVEVIESGVRGCDSDNDVFTEIDSIDLEGI